MKGQPLRDIDSVTGPENLARLGFDIGFPSDSDLIESP